MAVSLLAMNAVFGRFFDVLPVEAAEPAAFRNAPARRRSSSTCSSTTSARGTVKAQIFGRSAARVFGVDVDAARHEIPKDYVSRMKMAYLDDGPAPSHRCYGGGAR